MIGYYVHHVGRGHLTRFSVIGRELRARGAAITGLGSGAGPDGLDWVPLPLDTPGTAGDATAGGVLHWAPRHHSGLRRRMAIIAGWIDRFDPALMVVDVSVEVTLLARLMGVPVVVVAMRGDRRDRPHLAAYDAADVLLAPWPAELPEPWWPERWLAKTEHVGALSRVDGGARRDVRVPGRALLLWSGDAAARAERLATLRRVAPQWTWELPTSFAASDVWAALTRSELVVTHAGQNAVAEVAAARTPAVVVADGRPHGEQEATAAALSTGRLAVGVSEWPSDERWPTLLDQAANLGGERWPRWNDGHGVARAATVLASCAAAGTDQPARTSAR